LGLLAVIAGLVGLYAAVGFLLVPRWTRSELVGLSARDFGRTLSVGDVRFNPFTWKLEITNFSLPDADGRPMISFGRLEVAVGISSVTRLAPALSDIVLESPRVSAVVRRDGKLNLADLEKPFAQPANARAPAPASKPFKLFVDRLAVTGGSAVYEDDFRPAPFRLDLNPIGFELLGFSTAGSTAGSYHLTATIGQGGRLDWTGTIRTAPISLRGALALDGLSARTVGTYLGPVLPAQISAGTLSVKGAFAIDGAAQGNATQGLRMTIDVPQAQVSGLGVRPRQAASDYVQLNRFTLGNAHIDLEQRSIRVGAVTVAGANVHGWLDQGGKLNLLELLGNSVGPPPPAAPAQPSSRAPGWRIAAPDIRIEDTRVSLEDRAVEPAAELTLGAMTARISGYDSSPRSRITVALQAAVNGKGRLQLTAAGALEPRALSAKLALNHIDLRALQPYLNKYTALTLASGFLSTALDIDRSADGQLDTAGRIDVSDLRAVDDDLKQDFIKWQSLHIAGFKYVSSPASLRIQRITAVAPYARVIIGADHTVNVSEALHPRGAHPKSKSVSTAQAKAAEATASQATAAPPGAKAPVAATSPAMTMAIGLVRVAGGTADYADLSMQPEFATGIEDLHGTIEGLSSDPSSRATVSLKGKVDRYAPVDISGVVNLLAATTYTDIRMKFSRLELTRMTPYSVRFAGYKIASGTLDANLHYKLDHGTLNADHTLVVDQLQLGDQVPGPHATKLPLRLAVALLKDRDGVIRIGLPVTGSLNNPQFRLGPLIGKALLHLLEKAVSAPFALLGRAFGGGPDMNRIDFAPGSAVLLPATQARVAALAKALAQRPQLQLQVPAAFAPDVDRPGLAKRKLRDELIALAGTGAGAPQGRGRGRAGGRQQASRPAAGKEVLELPATHYRLLRAAYQSAFGPKAPLPASAQKVPPYDPAILEMQTALLKRTQVSDADLQALGQRRAEAIRSAIIAGGGVAAGRVAITAGTSQPATAGQVAVKLGLK
jgi:hypothetical protein